MGVSRHPKTLLDSSRGCVEDGGPSAEAVKRVHGSHCRCDSHTTWVSGSFDSSENSPCGGRRESGDSVHLSSSDNASFTTPPQAPTPQVILSRSKDRVLEVGSALTGTQAQLQVQVRPVRQVGQSPMPARVSTPATSPTPS